MSATVHRLLPGLAATLALLVLPSPAAAGWTEPLTLARASVWPSAVAADSEGDTAVAWTTITSLPPKSLDRRCSAHPFEAVCHGVATVHLAVRTHRGRLLARTVWAGRSGEIGMSLVIGRGEVTVAMGSYDVSDPNETAREVHGPLLGPWSRAKVLGHFLDYLITGGHAPVEPQLAVAPDGLVLATWGACGSLNRCPGPIPGAVLAWRAPGKGFGRPSMLAAAPEGAAPSFDSAGGAYLHSSCSARVLRTPPGRRTSWRAVTLTRGHVRDLSFGLSGPGEGLVTWIPTACSVDEAGAPIQGPVLSERLVGGVFGAPDRLTAPGASADQAKSTAVPGGGVVGWVTHDKFGVPEYGGTSVGPAPILPTDTAPLAADGGGDVVLGAAQPPPPSSPRIAVIAPGSTAVQPAPAPVARIGTAPFGRTVAISWSEPGGPLELSVWRP